VHLKFSDISKLANQDKLLEKYQLEKSSITWKINVEEKQNEIKIIRDEIKNLVSNFDELIKQIIDLAFNPNLKENYDLSEIADLVKSVDTPLSFITKLITKIEKSVEKLDY